MTTNPKKIAGIIGQFVDMETIATFRNLLNKRGILGYNIQEQNGQSTNLDFRDYFMPLLGKLEKEVDLVVLVGANLRLEASLLNVELRKLVLRSAKAIYVGNFTNLTYKKNHNGNGIESLVKIALGKSSIIKDIIYAKHPTLVFGFENTKREDGDNYMLAFNFICGLRGRL